jgi:hypothetical protein
VALRPTDCASPHRLAAAQQDRKENVGIIVVDDDTLYPSRLVETLLHWHIRIPDAALSFSGWPVTQRLTYPHWTENYLVYGNEVRAFCHTPPQATARCGLMPALTRSKRRTPCPSFAGTAGI